MKYYQTPNTQLVRLTSGDVLDSIDLGIGGGSGAQDGGIQSTAMTPRRIYT